MVPCFIYVVSSGPLWPTYYHYKSYSYILILFASDTYLVGTIFLIELSYSNVCGFKKKVEHAYFFNLANVEQIISFFYIILQRTTNMAFHSAPYTFLPGMFLGHCSPTLMANRKFRFCEFAYEILFTRYFYYKFPLACVYYAPLSIR